VVAEPDCPPLDAPPLVIDGGNCTVLPAVKGPLMFVVLAAVAFCLETKDSVLVGTGPQAPFTISRLARQRFAGSYGALEERDSRMDMTLQKGEPGTVELSQTSPAFAGQHSRPHKLSKVNFDDINW
jgi:hypothetical protein